MGVMKYLKLAWNNQDQHKDIWSSRKISWRKEPVTVRVDHPTRLDRARALGYRAKPGFILVRQRVDMKRRMRPKLGGRRPRTNRRLKIVNKNYQQIAEERAQKKYVNCEVLNSYYVLNDGQHYWYEVILVDKSHPAIIKDQTINWITKKVHTGRVFRGLTSAGKKSRGMRSKGFGAENIRPSVRANAGHSN